MKAERPLKVIFYQTDAGNEPVREWLKGLSKEDCKTIGTDILTVQYAWPVGKPLVDNLGERHLGSALTVGQPHCADIVCAGGSGNCAAARFHQEAAKDTADELELAKKRKRRYIL